MLPEGHSDSNVQRRDTMERVISLYREASGVTGTHTGEFDEQD